MLSVLALLQQSLLTQNEQTFLRWLLGGFLSIFAGVALWLGSKSWSVVSELRDGFREVRQTLYGPKDRPGGGLVAAVEGAVEASHACRVATEASARAIEIVAECQKTEAARIDTRYAGHVTENNTRFDKIDSMLSKLFDNATRGKKP